ncbi:hypothetical protein [Pedobacter cryophilus]|uniref:Uncharacterized protein n=1 Tax=Pedobacter cryophilus TaxID=2571271 RepID=A0A4U1BV39_9SPHI|nr:hypothetical protein [Pedobacter cryophilus]TKB95971.1 hypothetical protein FA046_14960 [Pedobacter cryophilus]
MQTETIFEGLKRFNYQIDKLEILLILAAKSKNPALSLYNSKARPVVFNLEALSRIYKNLHNKKRFERMQLAFKTLEDQLGKIDYYESYIKEFTVQENFPKVLLDNLTNHYHQEIENLDKILKNEQWIDENQTKLNIIKKELADASWKSAEKDRKKIAKFLIEEIDEIEDDYKTGALNFADLEHGVHEFRRQIRWISIYALVLNGLIQLKPAEEIKPELERYLTKETINSPFNKLPEAKEGVAPIYIDTSYFYALSWLIAKGGDLKDEGLRIICLETTIKETAFVEESKIKEATKILAINNHQSPSKIKAEMKILADYFMLDVKVLSHIKNDIGDAI